LAPALLAVDDLGWRDLLARGFESSALTRSLPAVALMPACTVRRRCGSGWDQRFESALLQQAVCLSGEPRGCKRKAPHFGGILRMAGDLRGDVQAASRGFFAFLSDGH
jgi:hypothetical protein